MRRFIANTLHPERYHGHVRQPPFFEGWYFKLIDRDEQRKYAVIPGIFKHHDPAQSHSFVQVLDGVAGTAFYHRYPAASFQAADDEFDLYVGPNHFRTDLITLDLEGSPLALQGEVRFEGRAPWPVTWWSPGIMGWYAWVPLMECYHGVLSFDHALRGELALNGQRMAFDGGRGYIEKDWGQAFPSGYVWFQTNHFDVPGTSLTASVAMIPWLGRAFRGFIIGLWHEGQLHRFATYTGARIEHLDITDDHVGWVVRSRQHRLEMLAERASGGLLRGPTREAMGQRVIETINGTVQVRLSARKNGTFHTLFEGTGRHAGLEVVGDLPRLLRG